MFIDIGISRPIPIAAICKVEADCGDVLLHVAEGDATANVFTLKGANAIRVLDQLGLVEDRGIITKRASVFEFDRIVSRHRATLAAWLSAFEQLSGDGGRARRQFDVVARNTQWLLEDYAEYGPTDKE